MKYEAEILQHVISEILTGEESPTLAPTDPLISTGRVDSLGLVQILTFIQQKFGTDLMAVGTPQDFDSVSALAAAVRRAKGEA